MSLLHFMVMATLLSWLSTYFAHPLSGSGYQWWSGLGSDLGEATIVIGVLAAWRSWRKLHECHVTDCTRLAWHPHPDHGHPVCRRHHPHHGAEHLAPKQHP